MTVVLVALVLAVAFAACAWSGRQLAHHYQDGREVVAIVVIGVAVLGTMQALRLVADVNGLALAAALFAATGGGMFAGYYVAEGS